jgi:hypothetical protein
MVGVKSMKDTEHKMQAAFCKWLRAKGVFHFAIPNGGARNAITGRRLKDEGVLAGVPDLFLPRLRLFIEMKAPNGKCTGKQLECHRMLEGCGYRIAVCKSIGEAVENVEFYLDFEEGKGEICQ